MKKLPLVLIAAGVVYATPAAAHTPTVRADCRVMSVDLVDYEPDSTVQIEVDGAAQAYKFDGSWHKAYPWDPTVAHRWKVTVDNRGDGVRDEWDQTFTGITVPCVPATTVPVVAQVDLTPTTVLLEPPTIVRTPDVAPAAVEAPAVLAFTGSHTQGKLILAWSLLVVGAAVVCAARIRAGTHPKGARRRP